jgi:hypothetical protein
MNNSMIGVDAVITEQKEAEFEGVEYQKSLLVRLNDLSNILMEGLRGYENYQCQDYPGDH